MMPASQPRWTELQVLAVGGRRSLSSPQAPSANADMDDSVLVGAPPTQAGVRPLDVSVERTPGALTTSLLTSPGPGPRVAVHPTASWPDYAFDLLQQWEGVVTRVDRTEFVVTLRDLSRPEHPEEEAVLPFEEISPDDLGLVKPGAVLYWSIGYETSRATGQVSRVSRIRLRRLPAWSRRDLRAVANRAQALMELFSADDDPGRTTSTG